MTDATAPADEHAESSGAARRLLPARREWRWLVPLLAAGLALRLFGIAQLRTYDIPQQEHHWVFAYEYGRIARSLALGKGYASPYELDVGGPTTKGCPLFPVYLSLLFRCFGVYSTGAAVAMHVGNSIASVVTALLAFIIGKRLLGRTVGVLAAVLFTFDPTTIWFSIASLWETPLSCLAFALLLVVFLWLRDHLTLWAGVLGGLVAGVLAHLHVVVLPVCLTCGIWLLIRAAGQRGAALRALAAMALVGAVVITPWSVRNSLIEGRPVVLRGHLTTFVARTLHPHPEHNHHAMMRQFAADHQRLTEIGDRQYNQEFAQRAKSGPRVTAGRFVRDTLIRSTRFWVGDLWVKWESYGAARAIKGLPLQPVKIALHTLVTVLAAIGFLVGWRRGGDVWLLFAQVAGYFPVYGLVLCTAQRYRFPIHASLLVLAACALERPLGRLSARWTRGRAAEAPPA